MQQRKPMVRYLRRLAVGAYSRIEKPLYRGGFLPAQRLCLPDFLGIGGMKCGTTWLYENLRRHPEIFLPEEKEPCYFNINFDKYTLNGYSRRFECADGRIKGDMTPGYSTLPPERIGFITRLIPHLKVILIIRDPIERCWSEAFMNLVVKPGRTFSSVGFKEFIAYFESVPCRSRSDYRMILRYWGEAISRERIHVGLFERIHHDPKGLLQDVFDFLGVSTHVDWAGFPYEKVIRPKYEPYGGVHGGIIDESGVTSTAAMSDECRGYLAKRYAGEMAVIKKAFPEARKYWS